MGKCDFSYMYSMCVSRSTSVSASVCSSMSVQDKQDSGSSSVLMLQVRYTDCGRKPDGTPGNLQSWNVDGTWGQAGCPGRGPDLCLLRQWREDKVLGLGHGRSGSGEGKGMSAPPLQVPEAAVPRLLHTRPC